MRVVKRVLSLLGLLYLLVLAFYAYRPFRLIPGAKYDRSKTEFSGGAAHIKEGAALEVPGAPVLLDAMRSSGQISVEVLLQTGMARQDGPARIISCSQNPMRRNFTVGQHVDALVFRLHTSETPYDGHYKCLKVPGVLNASKPQHFVATFDGTYSRLYVDGQLHPQSKEVGGNLKVWTHDHILMLGDETAGGRAWNGKIFHFNIYDRALSAEEVGRLYAGEPVPGVVLGRDFKSDEGVKPLLCRNLFITDDPYIFQLRDCVANIAAFIPLAWIIHLWLPAAVCRKQFLSIFVLPLLAGLAISGTIEFSQRFIDTRVPCLIDLGYNVFGTLLGCITLLLWCTVLKQRRANS